VHAELDLSILGLAPFGDVQLGHDLETRNQGIAKGRRNLLVAHAVAVDAEADAGIVILAIGFDVDIGRPRWNASMMTWLASLMMALSDSSPSSSSSLGSSTARCFRRGQLLIKTLTSARNPYEHSMQAAISSLRPT